MSWKEVQTDLPDLFATAIKIRKAMGKKNVELRECLKNERERGKGGRVGKERDGEDQGSGNP